LFFGSPFAMPDPLAPEVLIDPPWDLIDFISDIHLRRDDAATAAIWRRYLLQTPADAVFILGDLFELWVGDDMVEQAGGASFESDCVQTMRQAASQRSVRLMCGNRDFLMGSRLLALTGAQALPDPCVLAIHGTRYLLSHGDALCTGDTEYQALRQRLRSAAWQQDFLGQTLAQRLALGRELRAQSQRVQEQRSRSAQWFDVEADAARAWLVQNRCTRLIHGHTHQPGVHDLGDGLQRWVLSDWDARAEPPRAQVLRLSATGLQRLALSGAAQE